MSLNAMSMNIVSLKNNEQNIYNLSNHGGFIEGTISLKINDLNFDNFKVLNKTLLKQELKDFLLINSKNSLSKTDMLDLEKELIYLNEMVILLEEFKQDLSTNFDEFNIRVEDLIEKFFFSKTYCSFLQVVFIHFFNKLKYKFIRMPKIFRVISFYTFFQYIFTIYILLFKFSKYHK
jgi:hypothetical protein